MATQTILLVQAEILVRHPLAEYLRDCGYGVLEAGSPDEARQIAASEHHFDIVLLDAGNSGGFELAQWFRTIDRPCEVIITGSVKKAVQDAMELCDDGPAPDHTARHRAILAEIQLRLAARDRRKA